MQTDAVNVLQRYASLKKEAETLKQKMKKLETDTNLIVNTTRFLTSFSEFYRDKIKNKIEKLANSALAAIFVDKEMEFRIIGNKTVRGLNYDIYIYTDKTLTPLKDCKGGGVLDVISLSLKISFLKMFPNLRQTMILDEPFRNLDCKRIIPAVEWLREVSNKLGIQFLIVTHRDEMGEVADKQIHFELVNGKTVYGS
jgi:DNA repair exonuclease SbcCD ATPase subunit